MITRTLLPEESKLDQLKQQRYTCNKLVQAGKTMEGASTSGQSSSRKKAGESFNNPTVVLQETDNAQLGA
jgi:hypothetical protein